MVLPIKIFEIKDHVDVGFLVQKLRNFREIESYEIEANQNLDLATEILDLKVEDMEISGVFSKDFMRTSFYKREIVEAPTTEEAQFWIKHYNDKNFLAVLAPSVARGVKKLLSGNVANSLSRILFIKTGAITEVKITHETLRGLHEHNPQATKLIWFDQIDIPGIEKLCLAGSDIADTELYQDYLKHGKIWYVLFRVKVQDFMIGLTRKGVITLFSKSTMEDFIKYVEEEVFKLIE